MRESMPVDGMKEYVRKQAWNGLEEGREGTTREERRSYILTKAYVAYNGPESAIASGGCLYTDFHQA
jgi:hypothetical protein